MSLFVLGGRVPMKTWLARKLRCPSARGLLLTYLAGSGPLHPHPHPHPHPRPRPSSPATYEILTNGFI